MRFVFLICCCWLIIGCERDTATAQFKTYSQRLANVLDINAASAELVELPEFPATRALTLPVEDIRIGILDAYELRKCGLFNLIAERNSILGKVQDKSRQLRYELMLIRGIEHCLKTLPDDFELYGELRLFEQQKQAQLPIYLWNMLVTGKEWRQQLTLFHRPFSLNEFYGFNETINAFKYLVYLSTQINDQKSVPNKQAERVLYHQEQIHPHHYFGQLVYSIALSSQWLDAITAMLESQEQRIICGEGRNQQTAQYLTNVFYKFFATALQSYLAELDSQYREVQPILSQLLQHSQRAPEMAPYINYYLMGEMHEDFRRATLDHVQFWQRTFKRCNIKVGRNPLG